MDEKEKLQEKGIKIRVIGNLHLLPVDLQKSIAQAMLMTKDNNKSILNVAFAYTAREEITNSLKTIVEGVEDNKLETEDLYHGLIGECLYTNKCNHVDLLVRTSGEMRFSDFLLWQVCFFTIDNKLKLYFYLILYFRRPPPFSISQTPFGPSSPFGTYLVLSSTISEATIRPYW